MDTSERSNKLLIVDDCTSNLLELIHILQSDYKIHTAKNGKSALEKVEMIMPDLVLLDVIMPDISGYDVITELKKSPVTKDIPVIFITGAIDCENENTGLNLGAVDYLRKPFHPEVVKHRVERQIQNIFLKRDIKNALEQLKADKAASKCCMNYINAHEKTLEQLLTRL